MAAQQEQTFDLKVDVHKKPKEDHPTSVSGGHHSHHNPASENQSGYNHRRFSNLSNLAQSLPSNSSSASALVPVSGSYDYLTSNSHQNKRGRHHRRKKNSNNQNICENEALTAGSFSIVSCYRNNSVRRTQSAFETASHHGAGQIRLLRKQCLKSNIQPGDDVEKVDADSEEEEPLLIKRHQSLDEYRRCSVERTHPVNLSSRSLDRYLDEKKRLQLAVKNEGKVLEIPGNPDENDAYQADLEESYNTPFLHLCKI